MIKPSEFKELFNDMKSWENGMTINELNMDNVVNELREWIDKLEPNKKHYWECLKCGVKVRFNNHGDEDCKCQK